MATATLDQDIHQIVEARHADPFRVLGMHAVSTGGELRTVVRAFVPEAEAVEFVAERGEDADGAPIAMERAHPAGFYELLLPRGAEPGPYRLRVHGEDGSEDERVDPYAFHTAIGDFDLYLMGEGTHLRLYEILGAHPMEIEGVAGVRFAVWAPGARRVSVGWATTWWRWASPTWSCCR
jgi:1,4-alpha-glucan branching enzyme